MDLVVENVRRVDQGVTAKVAVIKNLYLTVSPDFSVVSCITFNLRNTRIVEDVTHISLCLRNI